MDKLELLIQLHYLKSYNSTLLESNISSKYFQKLVYNNVSYKYYNVDEITKQISRYQCTSQFIKSKKF